MTDKIFPKARKPRGFEDKDSRRLEEESGLIRVVSDIYERWGYQALATGAFEYADALGQFLPDADRPNAGVFALSDDDGQWMSLRYDHTAPLARYVAENRVGLAKPFKRYACGPVWRNEKPGPFRFREFSQCDADAVGIDGIAADAEMVAMACEIMEASGVGEYCIRVNTRSFSDGLLKRIGAEKPEQRLSVMRALDKLDRLGESGVADLLGEGRRDKSGDFTPGAGLSSSAISQCLQFLLAGQPERQKTLAVLSELLGEEGEAGLQELTGMDAILQSLGKTGEQVRFDPSVVRGLDYYTGPVFEAECIDQQRGVGSVGGGGRYDDLIARFGGDSVPATGFSLGISRLAVLKLQGQADERVTRNGPVLVLAMDRDHMPYYCAMAASLRAAGVSAEVYLGKSGMRAQMKYADRRLSPAVVIVGEKEREGDIVTIKDMQAGIEAASGLGENEAWRRQRPGQFEVPASEMVSHIEKIVRSGA